MKRCVVIPAVLCALSTSAVAANFTTTTVQAAGTNWTAAIWQGTSPTPGNTYETLPGARIRTPFGTAGAPQTFTFPGDLLQIDGTGFTPTTGVAGASSEIRFKSNDVGNIYAFPGVAGNPGLILNGGILNDGDERLITLTGLIGTATGTVSSINPGGQATTDISV